MDTDQLASSEVSIYKLIWVYTVFNRVNLVSILLFAIKAFIYGGKDLCTLSVL